MMFQLRVYNFTPNFKLKQDRKRIEKHNSAHFRSRFKLKLFIVVSSRNSGKFRCDQQLNTILVLLSNIFIYSAKMTIYCIIYSTSQKFDQILLI